MPREFKDQFSFRQYILKLGHQIYIDMELASSASNEINLIAHHIIEKLINYASQLTLSRNAKTLSSKDIEAAVKLVLVGDLSKNAIKEATNAVSKFRTNKQNKPGKKHMSKSERSGLIFPVSRVANIMKTYMKNDRLSGESSIYLTAVLEYIIAEILELASHSAKDFKKKRISTKHIADAIRNDSELGKILEDITLSGNNANPSKRLSKDIE